MTRPRSDLTREELALAYELRQEGCCWKRIAQGLGCDHDGLRKAVWEACQFGAPVPQWRDTGGRPFNFPPEQIKAVMLMRWHGLGWGCIARYFETDRDTLRHTFRYARD